MNDGVAASHALADGGDVAQVAGDTGAAEPVELRGGPGVADQRHHVVPATSQAAGHLRPDEPGGAGHENLHPRTSITCPTDSVRRP